MLLSLVTLTFYVSDWQCLFELWTKKLELFVLGETWHLASFKYVEINDNARFFPFRPKKTFLGQVWKKTSEFFVQNEFWYMD